MDGQAPGLLFLAGLVAGAGIALVIGLHADRIGRALGLLDFPDPAGGRKLHGRVTPLVGGLAVLLASLAGLLVQGADGSFARAWFAIAVIGMFATGIADDRFGLTAPFRLLFAGGLLTLVMLQAPDFRLAFLLFEGQRALLVFSTFGGIAFSLLCLIGFLNAVNMADGKNGLVIGQAIIWSLVLMVRLPPDQIPLLGALLGALLVLFGFNMRGLLFMGDSGSYALSAIFGLLAIYAWNTGFADMRAEDLALIFALPVFDTIRLILHRILSGKSPFTPGRDHLHHYLFARWGWPRPLPWVLLLVALPNLLAILLPGTGLVWLALTLLGYFLLLWAARRPVTPASDAAPSPGA
ncbi:MAG: MraY family glycosyltransferase [Sphingomonadaceae bacterium]